MIRTYGTMQGSLWSSDHFLPLLGSTWGQKLLCCPNSHLCWPEIRLGTVSKELTEAHPGVAITHTSSPKQRSAGGLPSLESHWQGNSRWQKKKKNGEKMWKKVDFETTSLDHQQWKSREMEKRLIWLGEKSLNLGVRGVRNLENELL